MWSWWFSHILHHFIDGRARYRRFVRKMVTESGMQFAFAHFSIECIIGRLALSPNSNEAMRVCVCFARVYTTTLRTVCIPICIPFEMYVALDSCMRFQPLKIHAFHFVCFFAPIYCVLNLLFAPLSNEMCIFFCLPPLPPPSLLIIFHHAVYIPSYISFRWLQSQRL